MMQTQIIPDGHGNAVHLIPNAGYSEIKLKLKAESYLRLVGYIKGDTLYVKRERSKHLYNKLRAYGWNLNIIKDTVNFKFDKINLRDEVDSWTFPRNLILEKGKLLRHQKSGFELQSFVTLDDLKPYETIHSA